MYFVSPERPDHIDVVESEWLLHYSRVSLAQNICGIIVHDFHPQRQVVLIPIDVNEIDPHVPHPYGNWRRQILWVHNDS